MQNFIFENPTRILFGRGQIEKTGKELTKFGAKALLVSGMGSIRKNGVYDAVTASLAEAGVAYVDFPGVRSNPVLSHVLEGVALARREGVDCILAVGGGSVMDTAKAIAAGIPADHDIWDFFTYAKPIKTALPIVTVVTVSASASEMNNGAVITREDGAQKFSIASPHIQPRVSILDPTVQFSLSAAYTAYSAVDIVTHMLEGYFNNSETAASPLQDRLVMALLKTVMESTDILMKKPDDYDARANLMWSAILGFNGLTTAGMGRVLLPAHMIEHSLSALYDLPHGAGLSIVLPAWMSFAAATKTARIAAFARDAFGIAEKEDALAARLGTERLKAWFAAVGSPVSLGEVQIAPEAITAIADNASGTAQVWRYKEYTRDVILEILKQAV